MGLYPIEERRKGDSGLEKLHKQNQEAGEIIEYARELDIWRESITTNLKPSIRGLPKWKKLNVWTILLIALNSQCKL